MICDEKKVSCLFLFQMIDWSIECPDLCWFRICQHLSLWDIAQLSSTCRRLRQILWSDQSSMWISLIRLKFGSSILCQSMRMFFDQDNEDEDAIITENDHFSARLTTDIESYGVVYKTFFSQRYFGSWHCRFTLPEREIRGFLAWKRFTFPQYIPRLDYSVPLSSKLFRLFYYR